MDKNTKDILDALDFIKERMATKADVAEFRLELHTFRTETEAGFRSLRTEPADINRRLDLIEQNYANLKGITKEIDEVRERVRDIEKHLGLSKKIAA